MVTKWEVYDALGTELYNALPQKAYDCDISISEAHCDRFGKDWDKFHEVEYEEFDIKEIQEKINERI